MIVTPQRWYMAFWTAAGVLALSPIYVLLYLILRAVKGR